MQQIQQSLRCVEWVVHYTQGITTNTIWSKTATSQHKQIQ